jgi:hypothetical protein
MVQNLKFIALSVTALALSSCTTTIDMTGKTEAESEVSAPTHMRTLSMFEPGEDQACYDRNLMPSTFVVDSHNHFRPFGGKARPFGEVLRYMEDSGVLFANVYGIGQSLPYNSPCTYYLNCIGTPALPSMKNDIINANNYALNMPENVVLTLSMTFPDLAQPEDIPEQIAILDEMYPELFKWMGEVNLVKQALFGNDHKATPYSAIARWEPFMKILRDRDIPIAIHSDLGSNAEPTKYLYLMEEVLRRYPENRIIWVHMGLSKELTNIPADEHIAIMSRFLDENPNLMLDITWRVIADNYFQTPEQIEAYTAFFNRYYDRVLTGTDFVASFNKNFGIYAEEVRVNSAILSELNDQAFRYITLGQSYFELTKLPYRAPDICKS